MDGSTEHSDSDSGESWTLLENASSFGDELDNLELGDITTNTMKREHEVNNDEDTDGISIISDSDPESAPCDLGEKLLQEDRPSPLHNTYSVPHNKNNDINHHNQNDILQDTIKHKTYVHRRNKRLSAMLNIIMLGSVITAAGVALGHMWGAKYECGMHTTPSVNKILSSLYKLKEENAFLRNKIKELTLTNNNHLMQQKEAKMLSTKHRCKKMFEEPLNNKMENGFKCVDDKHDILNISETPEFHKEFVDSIDQMKHIYNENKSWINAEIEHHFKANNNPVIEDTKPTHRIINLKKQIGQINSEELDARNTPNIETDKKITYADSLKLKASKKVKSEIPNIRPKRHINKKKLKGDIDSNSYNNSYDEEDIKKDDRYVAPRGKVDRKKNDRQKLHKKQKRKNKYEQWEMKGGYLKDYDEFSITSSISNVVPKSNQKSNPDFEIYINKFTETDLDKKSKNNNDKRPKKENKDKKLEQELNEKRQAKRKEARKKLELELFGEPTQNAAAWYFKRMQKREQCRAQKDNSTFKKYFKHRMNYKIKQ